jgi:hypothetical protein
MGKYIISGLGPSQGGVGRLVKEIIEHARENYPDIELIYIYAKKNPFFKFLKESFLGDFLKTIFYKLFTQNGLKVKLSKIYNANILLIHPQTFGFSNFYKLFDNGNAIYLYVMDCSFFCLKSYNHIKPNTSPCLQCLASSTFEPAILNNCKPFPVSYSTAENIEFLKFLKINYRQLVFLAQNERQQHLIKNHFGEDAKTLVVGMYTNEIVHDKIFNALTTTAYDMVYHGSLDEAKGLRYVLQMAPFLTPYTILVPYTINQVKAEYSDIVISDNIVFKEMTWETGLAEAVSNAKMVVNPSVWSAPIEGALLKSINSNGCVAAVNAQYSFASELIKANVIIGLNDDIQNSASRVNEILSSSALRSTLVQKSKEWLNLYLSNKSIKQTELFEAVF